MGRSTHTTAFFNLHNVDILKICIKEIDSENKKNDSYEDLDNFP